MAVVRWAVVCAELVTTVDGGGLVRSGSCFGGDGCGLAMWGVVMVGQWLVW